MFKRLERRETDILRLMTALLSVDEEAARGAVTAADSLDAGLDGALETIVPALDRIGILWETGDIALSQFYMSGRIAERIVDSLLPAPQAGVAPQPKAAFAALEDHHSLGKRIVRAQLCASGWEIADFGRMEVEPLAARVARERIGILLVSTLLLSSALRVRDLRDALDRAAPGTRLLVGGAPFRMDAGLHRRVGADAAARDGREALALLHGWRSAGENRPPP